MPVMFDVTDRTQIQAALDTVDALDILINNAGVSVPDDLNDCSALERLSGNHPRFGARSGSPPESDWVPAASE